MLQVMYVDDVSAGFLGVTPWQINRGVRYDQFLEWYIDEGFFGCQQ